MPRENMITAAAARLARFPFWLQGRRPFTTPQKVLILKPCCLSQVILATPLLAALSEAYPQARFDWAVSEWARPAIAGNPRLTELILTGSGQVQAQSWSAWYAWAQELKERQYDTCVIPDRSSLLSLVAWWAGIPQRVGLHVHGQGFAHTLAVKPGKEVVHEAAVYLSLAAALGVSADILSQVKMEFYPLDPDRTALTQRLVQAEWLGDAPLVVVHPGGGINPVQSDTGKQWPVERFALLVSYIMRRHKAQVILVGGEHERPLIRDLKGLIAAPVISLAGEMRLGELGALCEVADLYIGNDAGPTQMAAAMGCPTVAIFGPSQPAVSRPAPTPGEVVVLWHEEEVGGKRPFSWENGVTLAEATRAVDELLGRLG